MPSNTGLPQLQQRPVSAVRFKLKDLWHAGHFNPNSSNIFGAFRW